MLKPPVCDFSRYPPESAGRLLTCRVPVVSREATIAAVERLLLTHAREFESISYVYVVDAAGRLKGCSPSRRSSSRRSDARWRR